MFSWSNSGNKGRRSSGASYPASRTSNLVAQPVRGSIRPPAYSRQQHLDSYLNDATLKPSTRRVSPDDSTYDTVFQTTSGDALILRVRLPPIANSNAPCRAPVMTLVGVRASHSWIDSRMCVVGYDPIKSDATWLSSGTTLGVAVNAVVRELQLRPPQILEITDPGLQRIQQSISGNNSNSRSASSSTTPPRNRRSSNIQQPDDPPDYESLNIPEIKLPDIPTSFAEVRKLDRDELQSILDDELEFLTLLHRLPIYKEISTRATSAMEANTEMATTNLAKEAMAQELYGEVVQLKATLDAKLADFKKLEALQDQQCAPPNVSEVKRKLQKAKKQALESSEKVAEEWLEEDRGGKDIDDFVSKFVKERTVHHERAAKLERLQATS